MTTPDEARFSRIATRAKNAEMRPLCSTTLEKFAKAKSADDVQRIISENPLASIWDGAIASTSMVSLSRFHEEKNGDPN